MKNVTVVFRANKTESLGRRSRKFDRERYSTRDDVRDARRRRRGARVGKLTSARECDESTPPRPCEPRRDGSHGDTGGGSHDGRWTSHRARDGSRPDGRRARELRPVVITPNYLRHAEGSALIEVGADARDLHGVGARTACRRSCATRGRGWVTAEYGMLPRSTHDAHPSARPRAARSAAARRRSSG